MFTDVDAVSASALKQIEAAGGTVALTPHIETPKPTKK